MVLSRVEEKVLKAIKSDEVVKFHQDIIRIRTVGGNEKEAAEYITGKMKKWGMEDVQIQEIEGFPGRANAIGWIHGKKEKPALVLTAHVDVIPIDLIDQDEWIVDPFSAEIREGSIYGRGSADHKSGVTIAVMTAKAIKDAGVDLNGSVIVLITADEEGWMLGVKQFIKSGMHKQLDAGIACHAGGGTINLEKGGRTSGIIDFYGRTAHAGNPPGVPYRKVGATYSGVNAIHKAGKFIAALDASAPTHKEHPIYGHSFWNALAIIGGWPEIHTPAQKPDRCRVFIDARLVPGNEPEDVWKELDKLLKKFEAEDPDFKAEYKITEKRPPFTVSKDEPIIKAVASAYEELMGEPPKYNPIPEFPSIGTGDTHYLVYEGIPCIESQGPRAKEPLGSHSANEHVPIDCLVNSTKTTALSVLRFLGAEEKRDYTAYQTKSLWLSAFRER